MRLEYSHMHTRDLPHGEGSSHGQDGKGGGQEPGVSSPHTTTFGLETSRSPRILNLTVDFRIGTKVRTYFICLSAGLYLLNI